MDRIITLTEFCELKEELIKSGEASYHSDGFDNSTEWKHPFGKARWREIELRPGLYICIYDEENQTSWSVTYRHSESSCLSLGFQLSGTYRLLQEGVKEDFLAEKAGESYFYTVPGAREVESYSAQSRLLRARIHIEPNFLHTFSTGQFNSLPDALQELLEGKTAMPFRCTIGEITPTTQTAWHQILNCPYQGMMKRMYLESKVLELVTLQFAQLTADSRKPCSTNGLQAGDIDWIHQAKDISNYKFRQTTVSH